jgi:hypothetical protein
VHPDIRTQTALLAVALLFLAASVVMSVRMTPAPTAEVGTASLSAVD